MSTGGCGLPMLCFCRWWCATNEAHRDVRSRREFTPALIGVKRLQANLGLAHPVGAPCGTRQGLPRQRFASPVLCALLRPAAHRQECSASGLRWAAPEIRAAKSWLPTRQTCRSDTRSSPSDSSLTELPAPQPPGVKAEAWLIPITPYNICRRSTARPADRGAHRAGPSAHRESTLIW